VKLLLDRDDVDINSKDNCRRTSLSLAWDGLNVNSKDMDGQTPLSLAATGGHEAVVKLLRGQSGREFSESYSGFQNEGRFALALI